MSLELAVGEERTFSAPLAAGELLHVVVAQDTINVELELFETGTTEDETSIWRANLRPWAWGEEFLFALPSRPTNYRLVVRSVSTRAGSVRLRVERRGRATSRDRLRFEAERAYHSTRFTRAQRGLGLVDDEWVSRARGAARRFAALDLPARQAFALKRVGDLLIQLGRPLDALKPLEEAIAIAQASGHSWPECRARLTWAEAVYARSVDEALAAEEYILANFSAESELPCRMSTLRLLVYDLNQKGDHRRSIELFEEGLPLTERLDAPWDRSALHMNVGSAYLNRGDLVKAIEAYAAAHRGYRNRGDPRNAILALENQVTALRALGEEKGLVAKHRENIAFVENHGQIEDLLGALVNYGETLLALDRPAEAETVFRRAVAEAENAPLEAQAPAWRGMGLALMDSGRLTEAKPFLDRGRRAHLDIGNFPRAIRDTEILGRWQEASGLLQEAATSYLSAADRAEQLRLTPLELTSRIQAAELLWRLKRPSARTQLDRAIELAEDVRRRLPTDRFRSSFARLLRRVYDLALELELAPSTGTVGPSPDQIERAFLLSERSRARSLREFLEASRNAVTAEMDPQLVERERGLLERAESLARQRFELLQGSPTPDPKTLSEFDAAIAKSELDLEVIAAERYRRDPRRAALLDARPVDLPQAQAALGNRTLVSFHFLEDRLLVFVVKSDGITLDTLRPSADLPAKAVALAQASSQPSRFVARFAEDSYRLWRELLAPLASHLDGDSLIISPDGWLHQIPFEALLIEAPAPTDTWSDLRFAIERYRISYAPSAGVLASLQRAGPRPNTAPNLVALGDSLADRPRPALPARRAGGSEKPSFGPLPYARQEVETVARLLAQKESEGDDEIAGHIFLGDQATETVARSKLAAEARYLHFAAHAYVDPELPNQSALLLVPDREHDGLLQLREILHLRFAADLVTLSACQSAAGRQESGEGVMSLARGFLFAGASSLVASLWEVSDSATQELMVGLYGRLLAGESKAEALRAAKLDLVDRPRSAHPYYWAPFVLIGNPE
ncbi:MAG: CHAT domain-containing tetratricopeptide repeat protein [Acidobacteriota bacterium]